MPPVFADVASPPMVIYVPLPAENVLPIVDPCASTCAPLVLKMNRNWSPESTASMIATTKYH